MVDQIGFRLRDDLTEGAIGTVVIRTPAGDLVAMGELARAEGGLIANGVHIHDIGLGANDISAANLRVIVEAFV